MRMFLGTMGVVQWAVRIFSTVFMGTLFVWCIAGGYIAGAILSGFGFAATVYVLYIRAIYLPRLRAKSALTTESARTELTGDQ